VLAVEGIRLTTSAFRISRNLARNDVLARIHKGNLRDSGLTLTGLCVMLPRVRLGHQIVPSAHFWDDWIR